MNIAVDNSPMPDADPPPPKPDVGQVDATSVAAAASAPPPLPPEPKRLLYFGAFRYLFDSPEWAKTLALGSLCSFIPVFGQVALLGYYYEIVERLRRDPRAPCPAFNFRRFAGYATRGVWPYLLALAISGVLQATLHFPLQYTMIGVIVAFQSSNTTGTIVAGVSVVVWLLIGLLIALAMAYVVQPLMLRGGLSQELRLMFRARWVIEYSKRVWLEIFLVQTLLWAAMCVLFPIGVLLFCFGILPMSVWMLVAGAHLNWQLYELALARGCEPIPLRPAEADEPPVVTGLKPSVVSTKAGESSA